MPFKPGQSGNIHGRPIKEAKPISTLQKVLLKVEKEIETCTPEKSRELVIALAGVIKAQAKKIKADDSVYASFNLEVDGLFNINGNQASQC